MRFPKELASLRAVFWNTETQQHTSANEVSFASAVCAAKSNTITAQLRIVNGTVPDFSVPRFPAKVMAAVPKQYHLYMFSCIRRGRVYVNMFSVK